MLAHPDVRLHIATEDPPMSAQDLVQDWLEQMRGPTDAGAVRRVADDHG